MTDKTTEPSDVLRRRFLHASTGAASLLAVGGIATAGDEDEYDEKHTDDTEPEDAVDEPEGFEATVLAERGTFTDDVAAAFLLQFADDPEDVSPVKTVLDDASDVVFLQLSWEPGGEVGWHKHPGPVLVSVTEGAIELVYEDECVNRRYDAGDAFLDPGNVHNATNPHEDHQARAVGIAMGIPPDEDVTQWVEPREC